MKQDRQAAAVLIVSANADQAVAWAEDKGVTVEQFTLITNPQQLRAIPADTDIFIVGEQNDETENVLRVAKILQLNVRYGYTWG